LVESIYLNQTAPLNFAVLFSSRNKGFYCQYCVLSNAMRHSHTSKIGNLLLCLRNNRRRCDHISDPQAKVCRNR